MDLKQWGIGGAVVCGGAALGFSQFGLNDVLSADLLPIDQVEYVDRAAYMQTIASEFAENFDTYGVESDTYYFEGTSHFSTSPSNGTFVELVRQDDAVPEAEIKGLYQAMVEMDFCGQDEMTMFTENGWTYSFTMQDSNKREIYAVICRPTSLSLKGPS